MLKMLKVSSRWTFHVAIFCSNFIIKLRRVPLKLLMGEILLFSTFIFRIVKVIVVAITLKKSKDWHMQSYVDYLRMIDNALIINKKVDKLTACRGVILTKWHCTAQCVKVIINWGNNYDVLIIIQLREYAKSFKLLPNHICRYIV